MRSTTSCPRIRSGDAGRAAAVTAAVALLFTAAVVSAAKHAAGTRWLPSSPDAVLLTLERAPNGDDSLHTLRADLRADPGNAALAARYIGGALRRYAVTGDPRLLGYASSVLSPWRDVPSPPADIWLLRGRLLQTEHRFEVAAGDLDRLLKIHPETVEAILLAADAWRRAGRIDASRRHCLTLQFAGRPDLASLCAADILLTLGETEKAYVAADRAVEMSRGRTSGDDRRWALSVLADSAFAAGHVNRARAAYEQALSLAPAVPLALSIAYVDFLLAEDDMQTATSLLDELPVADAVLLRRAMAAEQSRAVRYPDARGELERRFAAADLAGTTGLHWRERALFALRVQKDASGALDFARRNWRSQKGREDAELLIRAAGAAGDPAAAHDVLDWRRRQQNGAS